MYNREQNTDRSARRSWAMTRAGIKTRAKLCYAENIRVCIPVAILGTLLADLASMVLSMLLPDVQTLMESPDMTVYLPMLLRTQLLAAAFGLVLSPLTVGSYEIYSALLGKQKPTVMSLFNWLGEGRRFRTALKAQLYYLLWSLGWGLVYMGPTGALYAAAGWWVTTLEVSRIGMGLTLFYAAFLLFAVSAFLGYAKILTMQPLLYYAANKVDFPIRKLAQITKLCMKGKKWEYLMLQLSFLGWQLLAGFTCGLGMLFVTPYMNLANIEFANRAYGEYAMQVVARFEALDDGEEPEGDENEPGEE